MLLSAAQDALELPCVKAALSRVNSTVLSASEGLYEASSGGGVLLMGDRVAHPISQVIGRPIYPYRWLDLGQHLHSVLVFRVSVVYPLGCWNGRWNGRCTKEEK